MRMETLIRKAWGLKAHTVVRVEARDAEGELVVPIERLGQRRLRRAGPRIAGVDAARRAEGRLVVAATRGSRAPGRGGF